MNLHDTLADQVALVSGANRGIGAQVAANLAELGATVYAGTRKLDALSGVQSESGGKIVPVQLDVSSEASIAAAVEALPSLDILVNNAGVGDWHGTTLDSLEASTLDKVLGTNIRGPMLLTKACLPLLLAKDGSRVVNVSSGMGALGDGMSGSAPAYRVSKTALNGFTAYLHGEYPDLIANCVCPGWVRTDMGGSGANRSIEHGAETPTWLARHMPGNPVGRFWRDKQVIDW